MLKTLISNLSDDKSYKGFLAHIENHFFKNDELLLLQRLIDLGQSHLFADWDELGANDEAKRAFIQNLLTIDESYPTGIKGYVENAVVLLEQAKKGTNAFEGFTPSKPETVDLSNFGKEYFECESIAMEHLHEIAVVLVAGGLGERLGYSGIKLAIPVETTTLTTYLQHYCRVIAAMESRMKVKRAVPLIIMTSQETHEGTLQAFEENSYFGLEKDQITILKQELVPAISDNEGHLALKDKYKLVLKPHGHGDIHMLMHTSKKAAKLHAEGYKHLLFIQDTNGQVFNAGFSAIGSLIKNRFDFNGVAVNRVPKEAVGAIAKLEKGDTSLTLNVEYNLLDPLLRSTIQPEGDVASDNGYSIFPGNINVLAVKLSTYVSILEKSGGIIAEFVNPKYKDDTRTSFIKPTRLETMMQDLPKLFTEGESVGVTIFDRKWCFSPNKNNIKDARKKYENKTPPECAATAESDFYGGGRKRLELAGVKMPATLEDQPLYGVPFNYGPRVYLTPAFALTIDEVKNKIKDCEIGNGSTLILDGENIHLENVSISENSSLVIEAIPEAKVHVRNLKVENSGHKISLLSDEEVSKDDTPEYLKIRGYNIVDQGAQTYRFDKPGTFIIDSDGNVIDG